MKSNKKQLINTAGRLKKPSYITNREYFYLIISILSFLFAFRLIAPIYQQSATFDEGVRAGAGYAQLKTGYYMYDFRSPPFSKMILAAPLILLQPSIPLPSDIEAAGDRRFFKDHFIYGYRFLFYNTIPSDTILRASRAVAFSVYILGGLFLFFFLFRKLSIYSAGIGTILYFLCPNIAALAGIATNDIFAAVFTIPVIATAIMFFEMPSNKNALFAGIALSLAVTSKYSLIAFALLYLYVLMKLYKKSYPLKKILSSALIIYGTLFLFLELNYLFEDPSTIFALIKETLSMATSGKAAYALGKHSLNGFSYYFPLAFLLKTPLPVIALIIFSAYTYITRKKQYSENLSIVIAAILIFAAGSLTSRLNLGMRYILPLYPMLFIFCAMVLHENIFSKKLVLLLFLSLCASNILIHPHYLSYFNILIGKNTNAYKYLADSSLDWGQDLKSLSKYIQNSGNPELTLSYFGTSNPASYGITYQNLESDGLDMVFENSRNLHINSDNPKKEFLAVSATCRVCLDYPNKHWFDFLNSETPINIIGNSIFVYDITGKSDLYKSIAGIYAETDHEEHLLRCGRVIFNIDMNDPFGILSAAVTDLKNDRIIQAEMRFSAVNINDYSNRSDAHLIKKIITVYLVNLIKKHEYLKAATHLSRLGGTTVNENNFEWHLLNGLTYVRMNNPLKAEQYLKLAALDKPLMVKAKIELGKLYERANDLTKALDAYEQAAAIEPKNAALRNRINFIRNEITKDKF